MLCVMNMVTTIVVGDDLGTHDKCQEFYYSYRFLS
jgi:hypothetical protein